MTRATSLLVGALVASCACGGPTKPTNHIEPPSDAATPITAEVDAGTPMPSTDKLTAIRNDNIKYATYTPPSDRGKAPPGLFRQISVTAPPEAFELSRSGDIAALDQLVPLLDDPDRNWAAMVMLSALTGHDAPNVIAFGDAASFHGTVGERDARKNWETWLAEHRAALQWDAERHQFRAK